MLPFYSAVEEEPKEELQISVPDLSMSTPQAFSAWDNLSEDQSNGMRLKKQRDLEGVPLVIGDGSGSSQFQVHEAGNGGMVYIHNCTYQVVGGFSPGSEDNAIDIAAEKKYRRMIKNRESAARSRARKQAYNVQILWEIQRLQKENASLKRKLKALAAMNMNSVKKTRCMPPATSSGTS